MIYKKKRKAKKTCNNIRKLVPSYQKTLTNSSLNKIHTKKVVKKAINLKEDGFLYFLDYSPHSNTAKNTQQSKNIKNKGRRKKVRVLDLDNQKWRKSQHIQKMRSQPQ
ncbi:hypothetical protein CAXC1_220022 [Candidatus Xenohaliotis californiensis]|uniref:Uncharacterized protein n=1 Tax=Candidatus Xenohaliotis californiensis TaxID=84677 RepID=A0ABP0ETR5_9RICK|nr:hypothetical protein CAXC1_220022 [Candidatus Xenohaliotis californiensis]